MSQTTVHRMMPGSHERPSGPECICGKAWSYYDGLCETQMPESQPAGGVDPETGEWRFDKNYRNLAQVEPFLPDYLARLEHLKSNRKVILYNDLFRGHIPGIAGEDEDTGIYLLQRLHNQNEQNVKVEALLEDGYRKLGYLKDRAKFTNIVLYPKGQMNGEWAEFSEARLVPNQWGTPDYVLRKGKRTHGVLVNGRSVLVRD